jgi:kynurenine formamidase
MTRPPTSSPGVAVLAASLREGRWVDLTPPIENGMPRWPAHPPVVVHPTVTHERDGYFNQTIFMSEHTGAHVDAPAHSHPGLQTIDMFPPEFLIGPAKIVHWEHRDWQPGELATAADVLGWEVETGCELDGGDIVLVNFGWLAKHWRTDGSWRWYAENMPGLSDDVADLLLSRGVRAVGSDTLTCGAAVVDGRAVAPPPYGCWLHAKLLATGVLLLECLGNLERLPNECLFFALPLPIKDGSGSPVRAAAFVPDEGPA